MENIENFAKMLLLIISIFGTVFILIAGLLFYHSSKTRKENAEEIKNKQEAEEDLDRKFQELPTIRSVLFEFQLSDINQLYKQQVINCKVTSTETSTVIHHLNSLLSYCNINTSDKEYIIIKAVEEIIQKEHSGKKRFNACISPSPDLIAYRNVCNKMRINHGYLSRKFKDKECQKIFDQKSVEFVNLLTQSNLVVPEN